MKLILEGIIGKFIDADSILSRKISEDLPILKVENILSPNLFRIFDYKLKRKLYN